jgi:hypothetical protein
MYINGMQFGLKAGGRQFKWAFRGETVLTEQQNSSTASP